MFKHRYAIAAILFVTLLLPGCYGYKNGYSGGTHYRYNGYSNHGFHHHPYRYRYYGGHGFRRDFGHGFRGGFRGHGFRRGFRH